MFSDLAISILPNQPSQNESGSYIANEPYSDDNRVLHQRPCRILFDFALQNSPAPLTQRFPRVRSVSHRHYRTFWSFSTFKLANKHPKNREIRRWIGSGTYSSYIEKIEMKLQNDEFFNLFGTCGQTFERSSACKLLLWTC